MSLYLTIFDGDEEVIGWVMGHYSDFDYFRRTVARLVKAADFPLLMTHSDCDGQWSPTDALGLIRELEAIGDRFRREPPHAPIDAFEHSADNRVGATSLYDCFHNVDGENLIEALIGLCRESVRLQLPILFQ